MELKLTIKYHLNDHGSLSKHLGKSGGGSYNWYSYLEGHLADILPILGEGLSTGRGRLYGILLYVPIGSEFYIYLFHFYHLSR